MIHFLMYSRTATYFNCFTVCVLVLIYLRLDYAQVFKINVTFSGAALNRGRRSFSYVGANGAGGAYLTHRAC